MKNLIYTLSLLVAFSLATQASTYEPTNVTSDANEIALESAAFDFDTKDYLPEGFDAYKGMFLEETASVEEATFDFDTATYLPLGFNPYVAFENLVTVEDEDAEFDFDINAYLPKEFDAYVGLYAEGKSLFDILESYPSI